MYGLAADPRWGPTHRPHPYSHFPTLGILVRKAMPLQLAISTFDQKSKKSIASAL
jgi:hypothetical protein